LRGESPDNFFELWNGCAEKQKGVTEMDNEKLCLRTSLLRDPNEPTNQTIPLSTRDNGNNLARVVQVRVAQFEKPVPEKWDWMVC
jgi:hypothetical protein